MWVVSVSAKHSKSFALKLCRKASSAAFLERELFALQLATGMDHVVQLAGHQLAGMRMGAWEPRGTLEGILLEHIDHVPFSELQAMDGWDSRQAHQCALCLLQGVAGLHSRSLLHGDIKPSNVLVHRGGLRATITDFGLATTVQSLRENGYGTKGCRAPENSRPLAQRQRGENQCLVEVWACGVVILCLLRAREWVWSAGELRSKGRSVLGTAYGQEAELHDIAQIAMMEHRGKCEEGVTRVWKERVGRCFCSMDEQLWEWLALEVMYLEVDPVQRTGHPFVLGRVSAAEAAASLALLKF